MVGVVRLLRRAGQLVWVGVDDQGPRPPRQLVAKSNHGCL